MTIRVGLIGAGLMMQVVHLPHLKQMKGVEVCALADLDPGLGSRVAGAYGIPAVYESAAEMVEKEKKLDAVIVVTRKDFHADAALPALERGIHVFVEKPLEQSIQKAELMVETARKTGALLMVGYMKRFDPSVQKLMQVITNNGIGRILQANFHDFGGDWTQGALGVSHLEMNLEGTENVYEMQFERTLQPLSAPREDARKVQTWQEIYDEWIEVWIHDVNLARAFFGEPEDIVYVQQDTPRLALIRYQRGRVLFEVGSCNYSQAPWDEELTFYGSSGRATLQFPAPLLFRQPTRLTIEMALGATMPSVPNGEPFQRELVHFFRSIQHQHQPLTGAEEALRDLKLCEAIAKA